MPCGRRLYRPLPAHVRQRFLEQVAQELEQPHNDEVPDTHRVIVQGVVVHDVVKEPLAIEAPKKRPDFMSEVREAIKVKPCS